MLDPARRVELTTLMETELNAGSLIEENPHAAEAQRSVHPNAALSLVELMRQISEGHYCAGWIVDLEYTLWGMVTGLIGPQFGMGRVPYHDLLRLYDLALLAGGWWRYSDTAMREVFVLWDEWAGIWEKKKQAVPDGLW